MQQYTMPKNIESEVRKNINILNWKNYKLPVRGKMTFLDDAISTEKKKGNAGYKINHPDWVQENNNKAIHGIIQKDCFYNKGPRLLISDRIIKEEKKKSVPPIGAHHPQYTHVEPRVRNLPKCTT